MGLARNVYHLFYFLFALQVYPNCKSVVSHISEIQNCIDYLLSKQFSSGNFPSSLENESDRLIHWCRGAPGAVYLMLKAYKVCESNFSSLGCFNEVFILFIKFSTD